MKMKRIIVGAVVGTLLLAMAPAASAAVTDAEFRRLKNRVTELSDEVNHLRRRNNELDALVSSLRLRLVAVEEDVILHANRLAALLNRTQFLNEDGTYTGNIGGLQVRSPSCAYATAYWTGNGGLSC